MRKSSQNPAEQVTDLAGVTSLLRSKPDMDFKVPGFKDGTGIWRRGSSLFTSKAAELKVQQLTDPMCWRERHPSPYKASDPGLLPASYASVSSRRPGTGTSAGGFHTARALNMHFRSLRAAKESSNRLSAQLGASLPSFSSAARKEGPAIDSSKSRSRQETLRNRILDESHDISAREFLWESDEDFSFVATVKDKTTELRHRSIELIRNLDNAERIAREEAEAQAEALRLAMEEAEAARCAAQEVERAAAEELVASAAAAASESRDQETLDVCVCGNVFMCDAQFCRRCGERRPGKPGDSDTQATSSQEESGQSFHGGKRQSHSEKLKKMRREMRQRIMDRVPDHLEKKKNGKGRGASVAQLEQSGDGSSTELVRGSGLGSRSSPRKSAKKPFVPFDMGDGPKGGARKNLSEVKVRDSRVVCQVICLCGNVFADDAQFCRKCGKKRPLLDEDGLALIEEARAMESDESDDPESKRRRANSRKLSAKANQGMRKSTAMPFPASGNSRSARRQSDNLTIVLEDRRKISKIGGGGTVSVSVDLVISEDRSTDAVVIKTCELSWPKRSTSRTIEAKVVQDIYIYGDVMEDMPEGRYEYLASLVCFEQKDNKDVVIALEGYDEAISSGGRRLDDEDILKGSFRNMFQERKMEFQHHDRLRGFSKVSENSGEKAKIIKAVADEHQIYVPVVESMHDWFEKMDVSGDGSIDKEEFGEFVRWLTTTAKSFNTPSHEISEQQFNRIWVEFNRAGGGEIKFPRFVEWLVTKWPHIRTMSVRDVAKFTGRG